MLPCSITRTYWSASQLTVITTAGATKGTSTFHTPHRLSLMFFKLFCVSCFTLASVVASLVPFVVAVVVVLLLLPARGVVLVLFVALWYLFFYT